MHTRTNIYLLKLTQVEVLYIVHVHVAYTEI